MATMLLIGDRDRDRASESLRKHYVRGRLTADELSARVDLALRSRTKGELRTALDGLPPRWEVGELAPAARAAGRVAWRAALFCFLVSVWCIASLVLLVVFLVALAAGASAATELGVVVVWLAITYATWRTWRRCVRPTLG